MREDKMETFWKVFLLIVLMVVMGIIVHSLSDARQRVFKLENTVKEQHCSCPEKQEEQAEQEPRGWLQ